MTNEQLAAMFSKIITARRAGVTKKNLMEFEVHKQRIGEERNRELLIRSNEKFTTDVERERPKTMTELLNQSERQKMMGKKFLKQGEMLEKVHQQDIISSDPQLKRFFLNQPRGSETGFRKEVLELNR